LPFKHLKNGTGLTGGIRPYSLWLRFWCYMLNKKLSCCYDSRPYCLTADYYRLFLVGGPLEPSLYL